MESLLRQCNFTFYNDEHPINLATGFNDAAILQEDHWLERHTNVVQHIFIDAIKYRDLYIEDTV